MKQDYKEYLLISKSQVSQLEGIVEELQCFIESCKFKPSLRIDMDSHENLPIPDFPTADELLELF